MKYFAIITLVFVMGISVAELKFYNLTNMTSFGLGGLIVDCEKYLARDKECKLEIKAFVENAK